MALVWTRMGRRSAFVIGLCMAGLVAGGSEAVAAPPGSGAIGGSGVHTSGTQTSTGAQASVSGEQRVIPTKGRNAHRGRGAPRITCSFRTIDAANPIGNTGGDAGNPNALPVGTQTWRTCYDTSTGARVEGPTLHTSTGGGNAGGPDITSVLVDQALANIDIDLPVPGFSPPGQTFPNFDTWFWTDDLPTQTASATAAGVTVTVTATRVATTFGINPATGVRSPDDGVVVTCNGAPRRYDPSRPDRSQTTTCRHRFAAPTRDLTVDTTATWRLAWTASNGTRGDLGTISRTATTPYRVQEKATVIRTPRS